MRLAVDPERDEWFVWHRFEPRMTPESRLLEYVSSDNPELRFLVRFLKPGMTVLDVGAHHGLFSIIAAGRVGWRGKVVSFEPSSRDRRRLQFNKTLNQARQITVEPFALGAQSGPASFYVVISGYTTMNSLRPPTVETPVVEVKVDMMKLDDYAADVRLTGIDLMKVDAEGAELDIFLGAERTIERDRPMILCEVLDAVAEPWGRAGVASIDYLGDLTYRWFAFREDGRLSPHARRSAYPDVRNYLAVPQEKLGLVKHLVAA